MNTLCSGLRIFLHGLAIFTSLHAGAEERPSAISQLIPWLLDEDAALKGIPFPDVIHAATGKRVIPIDRKDVDSSRVLKKIGAVLDAVLADMNAEDSPTRRQKRVNEMSKFFEDSILSKLNAAESLRCGIPKTASGVLQRSGYPDLRLTDLQTGRIYYLDPKLYAKESRASSLRTFYFTPKRATNKVNDDAHHLVVGIEHHTTGSRMEFARWELIDLALFRVQLKAEFEGSNAALYRKEAIVGSSAR